MADHSAIEWTATVNLDGTVTKGATWNPVRGCVKVSAGCNNCYAETFAERFRGVKGHPYEQGFDLRLVPEKLAEPLAWKKPRRVFVNSMSDLFQDGVPDSYIDQVFAVMALAPQHTFQVLTKRADRMRAYMTDLSRDARRLERAARELGWTTKFTGLDGNTYSLIPWPLPNVWLGVSVENQHFADARIPLLLQTPAAVRFISAEPLLEPVNLRRVDPLSLTYLDALAPLSGRGLDWVIVGGESGSHARPCHSEWISDIVTQCRSAGVPVFVKQLGSAPYVRAARLRHWEWRHIKRAEDRRFTQAVDDALGWRVHLASTKGGDLTEWPDDLRVREWPAR